MGFSLALGAFPKSLLEGRLEAVLEPLMKSCLDIKDSYRQKKFAEARRDAICSITRCVRCGSLQMNLIGPKVWGLYTGIRNSQFYS